MTRFVKWLALVMTIWFSASACAESFKLTSTAAPSMGNIPTMFTCDGKNLSPHLSWMGVPAKTEAFALIVSDPDATSGTFYHWVLFNIPKTTTELAQEAVPPVGTVTGNNSSNHPGYYGPCPPPGQVHRYIFTLYALDGTVGLTAGSDAGSVLGAIQSHIVGQAEYVMTFKR